jgi:hypothetical protein
MGGHVLGEEATGPSPEKENTAMIINLRNAAVAATLPLALSTATHAGYPYEIIDLTEIAESIGVVQSEARGINEAGQITGFELLPEYLARAIYWDADLTPSFPPTLEGDNTTFAVEMSEDGAVLGQSVKVTVEHIGDLVIIRTVETATLWREGQVIDLNTLVERGGDGWALRFTQDAAPGNRYVGHARIQDGPGFLRKGFFLEDGVLMDLELLTHPMAMNNHRQVVGSNESGQAKAYLWDNGVLTNLHDHPRITGVTSRAFDINDAGIIVGEAQFHISKPEEAVAWIQGVPERLIPDYNRPQGQAHGVNGKGRIVGFYNDLDDTQSPWIGFVWDSGVRTELLDLVPPSEGWEVLYPFDINDKGEIVGGGFRSGRAGRAFLMRPVGGCIRDPLWVCDGDVDGNGAVNPVDVGLVQAEFCGADDCPEEALCQYDLDCNGSINPVDSGLVQSLFGTCDPPRGVCP